MKIHLERLLLLCVLLLLLPMAAFAEEAELPVEWVRYGYGLPNPASVDAHELAEEALTLEGIAYAPKLENGRVYVRLENLAAAKLVRENGEALQQLGLGVSDLQLENGQLKAPGKEDALAQFLNAAAVGVSVNDSFTLANAGEGKLIIRIAGFASKDDTAKTGDTGVQVAAKGEKEYEDLYGLTTEKPLTTTVYVYYSGYTEYKPPLSLYDLGDDQEQPSYTRVTSSLFFIGVAYSQEDLDNGVRYYLTLDKENPTPDRISICVIAMETTSFPERPVKRWISPAKPCRTQLNMTNPYSLRVTERAAASCFPPSVFPQIPRERM